MPKTRPAQQGGAGTRMATMRAAFRPTWDTARVRSWRVYWIERNSIRSETLLAQSGIDRL